jgi:putative transposase
MIRMRSHRIELKLNDEQRKQCAKSAGISRYAYNWKLGKLSDEYEALKALATMYGLDKVPNIMGNAMTWHKEWNILKNEKEWIREASKCCGQEALRDLQGAYAKFFKKQGGYPKFHKKGVNDSFRLTGAVYIGYDWVKLPNIGLVKLKERGYVPVDKDGKIELPQITISRQADHWFVSFLLREDAPEVTKATWDEITADEYDVVGLDLGIKDLAITSYGETYDNPKAYKKKVQRLKRYQRSVSRKKKGSKNRKKAITKLSRLHKQVADIRTDASHKMTTQVVKTKPKVLVIESLKPKNMSKNRKLAGSILDASFGKIKMQFQYKSEWSGIRLVMAPIFYASSKFCSSCGYKKEDLKLEDRDWVCPVCGEHHDRDVNAARNLRFFGLWLLDKITVSSTGLACSESECFPNVDWGLFPAHRDGRLQFFTEQCLSMKQEFKNTQFALVA